MDGVGVKAEVSEPRVQEPETVSDEELLASFEQEGTREIENTIATLVEYYGTQQFHYNQHDGTIIDIINLCPPIRATLKAGPAAIIAWVDEYKVDELVPPDERNSETDEEVNGTELSAEPEATGIVLTEEKNEPAKEAAALSLKDEPSDPDESIDGSAETVLVKKEIIPQDTRVVEIAVPEVAPKKIDTPVLVWLKPEIKEEAVEEIVVEPPQVIEAPVSVATEMPKELVKSEELAEDAVVLAEILPEILVVVEGEASVQHVSNEPIIEQEEARVEYEVPVVQELANVVEEPEIVEHPPVAVIEDEALPLIERVVESSEEELTEEYRAPTIHVVEKWHEIAVAEPPLDTFFAEITEQLDEYVADEEVIVTEEQLNIEIEAIIEENLEKVVQPELIALLRAVRSSEESLKKLYQATTKQECETCIDQIVLELSVILRALGYENPEMIIRDYLHGNSPDSLQKLIKTLEASLCRAIRHEARQKPTQAPARHIQVGKFVNYVMNMLLHKPVLSSDLDYV